MTLEDSLYKTPWEMFEKSITEFNDYEGATMSTFAISRDIEVFKEMRGTDVGTETSPEPPIISRGSVWTSLLWVGPSILLSEVEGPPSWPTVSVAGTGLKDKLS